MMKRHKDSFPSPKRVSRWHVRLLGSCLALAALALVAAPPVAAQDTSYGYFRTVEGVVRLTTYESGEAIEVEPNYPVLVGDRIWVTHGARLEAVLPDRTVVRADGATDLFFDQLALSADGDPSASTVLGLLSGELLIEVPEYFGELEPIRVDTTNTTVYLQSAGLYRLFVEEGWVTQVVVRDGFAEVLAERGSVVVRTGEEAWAEGGAGEASISVRTADARVDALEAWSSELAGFAVARESSRHVDRSLAYAAAPLDQHGSWLQVSGSWAWQPRVPSDWRPYSVGWWIYTPAGLTWVASEPWGWVTSHYGSWNYSPVYGWVWYPGLVYSPAWVVWYWGPTHVGWVPLGYYSHFYYPPGWPGYQASLFRFGVYGWAGGNWDYFAYWTFCPTRYFGRRYHTAYWHSGVDYARHGRQHAVPRGIVTVDSRPLTPSHWGKPNEGIQALEAQLRRSDRNARIDNLGDITDFVARRRDLPAETRRLVFRDPDEQDSRPRDLRAGIARRAPEPLAPWSVQPPLPDELLRESQTTTRLRDSAVLRGGRADAYRGSYRGGTSGAPGLTEAPEASRRETLTRGLEDRFGGDRSSLSGYTLPQSGGRSPLTTRQLPPAGRQSGARFWERDESGERATGQVPLVRRLLDGIRSRTPSDSGAGQARPAAPDDASRARPAPPPERPEARPSSPPPSSRGSSLRQGVSSSRSGSGHSTSRPSGSSRGSTSSRSSSSSRRPPS